MGSVSGLAHGLENAMGIMQYAHRRLMAHIEVAGVRRLPLHREVRKDRRVPLWINSEDMSAMWQVYCDDFDVFKLVPLDLAVDFAGRTEGQVVEKQEYHKSTSAV